MATANETEAVKVDDAEGDTAESTGKEAKFYCPGCGKRSDLPGECVGGEFGHAPIAYVSTKELAGDESKHTPAPNTD
jgi:hypothetical protein